MVSELSSAKKEKTKPGVMFHRAAGRSNNSSSSDVKKCDQGCAQCDGIQLLQDPRRFAAKQRPYFKCDGKAQKMLEEKAITADWVTSDIIEVWPCIPIPDRMIHGRATPKCYNTVPVTLYSQIQLDAFLDPKTEELKSTGEEVECRSLYYRLDSTLHRYDQPNGVHTVVEESAVKEMQDGRKNVFDDIPFRAFRTLTLHKGRRTS
uniref:Uncharacterized protein n=1 Tax=Ditylenchus dipsaci TaxID=166011 RepID=A0A915D591_9BILA